MRKLSFKEHALNFLCFGIFVPVYAVGAVGLLLGAIWLLGGF